MAGGAGFAAGGCQTSSAPIANPLAWGLARGVLTLAYGFGGLGYIVTAVLPVIARGLACWLGGPTCFWPLFGMGVAMGPPCPPAPVAWDRRWLLLVAYLLQASDWSELVWPGVGGVCAGQPGSGLPFTAITFFGFTREARRVWPSAGTASPGCSPPLTVWVRSSAPHGGLDAAPRHHAQPGLYQGLVAAAAGELLGRRCSR